METRAVIKFFILQGKRPKNIHAILTDTLGEYAPPYATVKNWVVHVKPGNFSACDALRPGRRKTLTTAEFTDQIHELILEDRQISTKSIAEELGVSCERVELISHEDLNMRKISANCVPKSLNAKQERQQCHSSEQFCNFFGANKMISCGLWRSWTKPDNVTMTRRQSNNQGSDGIAAQHHPPKKFPNPQICYRISRLNCLRSRSHPTQWLSYKGPNSQFGVLPISAGAIEGHFEGNTPREVHQAGLVLARLCSISPATCNPEDTVLRRLPLSWWHNLFSESGPVGLPHVPWTDKQLKCRHFSPGKEVIIAARTWLDRQHFFEFITQISATV